MSIRVQNVLFFFFAISTSRTLILGHEWTPMSCLEHHQNKKTSHSFIPIPNWSLFLEMNEDIFYKDNKQLSIPRTLHLDLPKTHISIGGS